MTEAELLKDTIDFYGADPAGRRAITKQGCLYDTCDGRNCAVGRKMTPEAIQQIKSRKLLGSGVYTIAREFCGMWNVVVEECRSISVQFWSDLQSLHDAESSWNMKGTGLSESGRAYVIQICRKHNINAKLVLPNHSSNIQA